MNKTILLSFCLFLVFLCSCATSNHGTFLASTYANQKVGKNSEILGEVSGQSGQIWFLYLFPIGDPPSMQNAISDAKSKIVGTNFLVDLSIDNRTYWKFGYSEQVIEVEAIAHK